MTKKTLADWLAEKDFSLVLSSGYFGFFAHCGLWKALHEEGLKPAKISGCSAGALVGAAMATGEAPDGFVDRLMSLRRGDFWDPAPGAGLLKGKKFLGIMKEMIPQKFSELKTPFQAVVYDLKSLKLIAQKSGDLLPEYVVSSCRVPLMFHPGYIDNSILVDGGVKDKRAFTEVDSEERIFSHYLLSKGQSVESGKKENSNFMGENNHWHFIDHLPRVSPFHLHRGPDAFYRAYSATKSALHAKIKD